MNRRSMLALVAGSVGGLAGCLGTSSESDYQSGDVPEEIEGEERTTEEMNTAEGLAEQEPQQDLSTVDGLSVVDHEFVFEEGHTGSTVQGTVENGGSERIESAEVRVRVYNDDGEQIGQYLDSTGDVDPGTIWEFEVILLESPEDIADYDIAVVGLPT